jgi:hypothetical protein
MTLPGPSSPGDVTAEDYNQSYYRHCLGSTEDYSWDSPGWRAFFTTLADRLTALLGPVGRSLDVGCANGMLVQAMLARGVDAHGFDISSTAVESAHDSVAERIWVASAAEPIAGRYDLVTCIEVLEHLSPRDVEQAVDNMCAVTDRVVLSSTPQDFDEPTHINVHPLADWVALFATRGFFRRTDMDLAFITPWAVCFERASLSIRDVVHRYESHLYPLANEVRVKREALLNTQRALTRAQAGDDVDELRHALLQLRDHARGAEAMRGAARGDTAIMALRVRELQRQIDDLVRSERWRIGGAVIAPAAALRRRVKGS